MPLPSHLLRCFDVIKYTHVYIEHKCFFDISHKKMQLICKQLICIGFLVQII